MNGNAMSAISRRALYLGLLVCSLIALMPGPAFAGVGGDLSCSASISPTILTAPPRFVGDTLRIKLNVGVNDIQGGTVINIPNVKLALVCFNNGGFDTCTAGADTGDVSFGGNGTITDTCAGVTFTGAVVSDVLTLTPSGTFSLAPNTSCDIEFDIIVNSIGTDATPTLIQEAAAYDGTCDNGLPGAARGAIAFNVDDCSVKVDKQVDCGDGQGFIDATLVSNNEDGTLSCAGVNGQPVAVRYRAQNTGTVDLFSCTITESNSGIGTGPGNIGGILETTTTNFFNDDTPQNCSDALEAGEPDTAAISCFCLENLDPNQKATASDIVTFTCAAPEVSITKVCDEAEPANGGTVSDIHLVITNTGDTNLTNCVVTDSIFLDDPACPANVGTGTDIPVDDIPGPIAPDGVVNREISFANLPENACNTAAVTCDVTGGGTTSDTADDDCEVPGDGCLTRTPGFWGTHPHVTTLFLPLLNCGLTVNNVLAATNVSAIEEMCSVGKDKSLINPDTSAQQIQLIRQCMAANLNVAATTDGGGNCESEEPGITALIDRCCNDLCPDDPTAAEINGSLCIDLLDTFNNSRDTLDAFGPFISPGPANPDVCKASKNNGFVNTGAGRNYGPK